MAYHGTRPGAVRRMLDKGELLFSGNCLLLFGFIFIFRSEVETSKLSFFVVLNGSKYFEVYSVQIPGCCVSDYIICEYMI